MHIIPVDAQQALEAQNVVIAGAARFDFETRWQFWSGAGKLNLDGEGEFLGVQAPALIAPLAKKTGGASDAVRLTLTGLDTADAHAITRENWRQKPVTIWRCVFDAAGVNLLWAGVYFRGRLDRMPHARRARGQSTLELTIEGSGRDFDRTNGRTRSNADQRRLGGATDGSLKHVSVAGEIVLYWGDKPERAKGAVNGGAVSGSGLVATTIRGIRSL